MADAPPKPIKSTIELLKSYPLQLLVFQIPAVSINPIQDFGESWLEENVILGLLLCLPYLFIASVISTGATYSFIRGDKSQPLFSYFSTALQKWRLLFPAALLIGLVTILGFVAVILPGIYFAALYLFVPYLILDKSDEPMMVYLNRSTKLASQSLVKTLIIVACVLFLMIWGFLLGDMIAGLLHSPAFTDLTHKVISSFCHLMLAIVLGAMIDVWICYYYLDLKEKASS